MEIILHKPKIICPECGTKIESFCIDGLTVDTITIFSDCDNCGADIDINVKFEDDPLFCNCKTCKQLNIDKDNEK